MPRKPKMRVKISRSLRAILGKHSLVIPPETVEILPLQAKLCPAFKQVWKGGSGKDIAWLAADLAALWEVSRVHINLVKKLINTKQRLNRKAMQQILIDIEINWFSNAPEHLKTMKGEIGRLRKSLSAD